MRALGTGEMSRLTGLSIKALRLYDANGLLVPAEVDPRTGYRRYAPEQLDRARTIAMLRRVELPLPVIAELLDATPGEARHRLRAWWAAQRREFAARSLAVDRLADGVAAPGATPGRDAPPPSRGGARPPAEVRFEALPDRAIASIVRTVEQPELVPVFLADALELRRHLVAEGAAPAAGFWVLFHSPVGTGLAGRIETAVPFDGRAAPTRRIALRVEPAARYAVADVAARDVGYPGLLDVYDAVRAAVAATGGEPAGAPREWYPGAWPDDPDALALHVALPVRGDRLDPDPGDGATVAA